MSGMSVVAGSLGLDGLRPLVLVVDDDVAFHRLMRVLMERGGFAVEQALDGAEAIEKIEHQTYAAILLDLMMPRVNGFEVLRYLQSQHLATLDRVIILTAASDVWLRELGPVRPMPSCGSRSTSTPSCLGSCTSRTWQRPPAVLHRTPPLPRSLTACLLQRRTRIWP